LVIAGRKLPDWNRLWPGWMANARVEELKPMTEEVMRQLIRRYYATMRGGEPESAQVEAIIRFARGLPMVVTSAVQLWVKYGVEDFQSVKVEIVANLVDRLMEGVPGELIPALEAAAIVRWFDQPILRAVTGLNDVRDVYNELRRFPFVRTRVEGLALHDSVRELMDENLRVQDPERHSELHEHAATYFEKQMARGTGEESERFELERLYHRIRSDENVGINLFQEMTEEIARYWLVNRLRVFLNDVNSHPLVKENSKFWRDYYNGRLLQITNKSPEALKIYQTVIDNADDLKLRIYALCDQGVILSTRDLLFLPGGKEKALQVTKRAIELSRNLDKKIILIFKTQSDIYLSTGEWDKAIRALNQVLKFYHEQNDRYGESRTYQYFKMLYAVNGDWRKMIDSQNEGMKILQDTYRRSLLYAELIAGWSPAWAWAGRYYEAESYTKEALALATEIGEADPTGYLRDLNVILSLQGKFQEGKSYLIECRKVETDLMFSDLGKTTSRRWEAVGLLKQGSLLDAKNVLLEVIEIAQKTNYIFALGEIFSWLGLVCETGKELENAATNYEKSLGFRSAGRHYFECAALTGLVRVKYAQGNYAAVPPISTEAEQLAQQYEYSDHLASLQLTQGHLAWENGNQDEAPAFYQQAMIYALRYNRFLLDELISGRPQGTPLRPIIPYCLERDEDGRKILIALRDWWKSGNNDVGSPRPDTISPIPEGISLLEAEKIAREREPGDGSAQKSVIEQIEVAIGE
jgi:tetratricopeptide (TPR) repeat protein